MRDESEPVGSDGFDTVALDDLPDDAVLAPATSAQRGLWLTHLLDPDGTAYHISHALRIRGDLRVDALRAALDGLTERHDSLRTSFCRIDEVLYQVVHPRLDADFDVVAGCLADADAREVVRAEFERPFRLHQAPLLRARLFTMADGSHLLTVVGHHLVLDGGSMTLLWSELSDGYGGVPGETAEPELQFTDYANWEADWVGTDGCADQVRFFRDRLRDVPAFVDLPLPRRVVSPGAGGIESTLLSSETTAALTRIARAGGATPFMVCLTLFAGVLHRWTDQARLAVGTAASLRAESGLANTVGMLINSVVVVTDWTGDPSFAQAVARVRAEVLDCLARQTCPFDHLVASLAPPRDGTRSPIFQVYCGFATEDTAVPALAGLSIERYEVAPRTSKFELSFDGFMVGDRLRCDLEWSAERFDESTARLFATHLRAAAEHAARHPEDPVGEWPLSGGGPGEEIGVVTTVDGTAGENGRIEVGTWS